MAFLVVSVEHTGGRRRAALIALFALLLVCSAPLTLSASAEPAVAEPVVLRMVAWAEPGERLPSGSRDIVEAFAENQRGVRLDLMYDRWPQARPRMRYWSGSLKQYATDLTIVRDVWLPDYASSLLPLDDVLSAQDLAGLTPSVVERCRVGGKLLGLPWRLDAQALYYRHDLLQAAGLKPPKTLGELTAVATKLSHPPGVYGLGLPALPGGDGVSTYLALLHAFGGEAVDAEGALQLGSEVAAKALAYWVELARAGATPPEALSWSAADMERAFADGRVAMVLAGQGFGGWLKRNRPQLAVGITAAPGDKAPGNQISCDLVVALASTSKPRECGAFLRFVASPRAQRALWMMGGLPVCTDHVREARQFANLAPFLADLETAQGWPLTEGDTAAAVIEHAIWLALSGREEPAVALQAAMAAFGTAGEGSRG